MARRQIILDAPDPSDGFIIVPLEMDGTPLAEGDLSVAEAQERERSLREAGLHGSLHFTAAAELIRTLSVEEMKSLGWIPREHANIYADYSY